MGANRISMVETCVRCGQARPDLAVGQCPRADIAVIPALLAALSAERAAREYAEAKLASLLERVRVWHDDTMVEISRAVDPDEDETVAECRRALAFAIPEAFEGEEPKP